MWFWWMLLASNLLYSLTMIICGWRMWRHCPKQTKDNADYAECGRKWLDIGLMIFVLSVLVLVWVYGKSAETIGTVGILFFIIECAAMNLTIAPGKRR